MFPVRTACDYVACNRKTLIRKSTILLVLKMLQVILVRLAQTQSLLDDVEGEVDFELYSGDDETGTEFIVARWAWRYFRHQ